MALLETITNDVKTAMKAGDALRTGTLRFVIAQIKNKEIEKKGKGGDGTLSEEETMEVLRKEVKKRREAADLYRSSGHEDMAAKEESEIKIIGDYLPTAPTEEDIRRVVAELKAGGLSDFGAIMKEARARLSGADGALIAKIAKE